MLGARFGKRPRVGEGAPLVFLFDKVFDLAKVSESEVQNDRAESEEFAVLLAKFKDIVWFTYRSGFVPMKPPSSYTTDAGWGCMLRSAQMLLAEVLVRHLGEHEWGQRKPVSDAHRNLLRWFIDAPKYFSFYSIHRMTECGRQYGKHPGEWYGPNTAALVLRDLVTSHRQRPHASGSVPKFLSSDYYSLASKEGLDIAVIVTDDTATIYLDEIEKEVGTALNSEGDASGRDGQGEEASEFDPLYNPGKDVAWSSSVFLIVPVRLGLNQLNQEYVATLIEALKFPQCVGMIGGKPAHSLYFVGSQGTDLLYLDPHTVQSAATEEDCDNEFYPHQNVVDTYHCNALRMIEMMAIDPSLAVGFFCKSRQNLTDLFARIGQLHQFGTPFINVMHSRPVYNFGDDSEDEEEGDGEIDRGKVSATATNQGASATTTSNVTRQPKVVEAHGIPQCTEDEEDFGSFFDADGGNDEDAKPDRDDFVFL